MNQTNIVHYKENLKSVLEWIYHQITMYSDSIVCWGSKPSTCNDWEWTSGLVPCSLTVAGSSIGTSGGDQE